MNTGILKTLFIPGGILLLCAVVLLQAGFIPLPIAAIQFAFYAVFLSGFLLAWRFHSSRILFALLSLFLSYRAIEFFSPVHYTVSGPGHIAFLAVAVLLPIDLALLAFVRERGLATANIGYGLTILFLESVFVAVICRPGADSAPRFLTLPIFGYSQFHWTKIPQLAVIIYAVALGLLAGRLLLYRKPVENGLFWSTAATFLGLHSAALGKAGTAYFATAGLVLVSSIIENSYALAYQDELTALPSRRAFNDALLTLTEPFSIAAVDIDHFKNFNDTYGHDTGDQVLRLVAGKLAEVGGGDRAYRVGGEEFSILFSGKSAKDVMEHLETLRGIIEASRFRVRSLPERRAEPRGQERRRGESKKASQRIDVKSGEAFLSVTVSIGLAESGPKTASADQVIQAADKALYKAKRGGRNRVEVFGAVRGRRTRRTGSKIAL